MNYIYIHGFNSAYDPQADKIKDLKTIGDVNGITYNSFGTYEEIFSEIVNKVTDAENVVFIGTSLGGFWASEMGRHFGRPCVLINPCCDPYVMLRKYVGELQTNYLTGKTDVLTDETVETYPAEGLAGYYKTLSYLPLVLLDLGDTVINSFDTMKVLKGFPIQYWEGGSHRFEHMHEALIFISEYYNHCSYVEHLV